ncbi:MAG: hypothetical protein HUK17_06180 [Bacteroidales bacterium]|nr:hypothetical protein [Bacteroidales bacterium]
MELQDSLKDTLFNKSLLKKQIYDTTVNAFALFRSTAKDLIVSLRSDPRAQTEDMRLAFTDRGDFEFELRFGSDVLIFLMHTNVFEFSRDHQVMKTPYIKEDPSRSFCGVIHIYNFLADSFDYDRDNDLGYMIGRVFINSEGHYFIEGKRELGILYTNFNKSVISAENVQTILESAIQYAVNFDLLTPPYDEIKVVSVGEMRNNFGKKSMVTAKRLGFRFQADTEN